MTFEQNSALPKRFVTAILPWILGAIFFVLYFGTMPTWVTPGSADLMSRIEGWSWQTEVFQPLNWLVLYPFRWLPALWIPPAVNVFNAALAALVITLVARTIALLPHDRTADQRELEEDEHSIFSGRAAWLPPVLGAIVLGLQIAFWECATGISSRFEMLDAFIAAYAIRCLLEFRIDQQQSWMTRAVFVYAAGMTNNWGLIGLAPVFLAAVIWLKGLSFFNVKFLTRTALWGFIGLLFYLVLPLTAKSSSIGLWQALKINVTSQLALLRPLYQYLNANNAAILPLLTSLLPLLFISLKWKSSFGDNSPIGIFIAKFVFHIVHAVFFAVCLLVTLNPPYSPRQLLLTAPYSFGGPQLTHSIISVLVVGYCAGYFLLICGHAFRARRMSPPLKFASYLGWGATAAMLVIMPAALIGRNWEPIRLSNKELPATFANHLLIGLPTEKCAIVSDDVRLLSFVRLQLLKSGKTKETIFYDTSYAPYSDYHKFQRKIQGALWPDAYTKLTNNVQLPPVYLRNFLGTIGTQMPVIYLQPSFGYYLESFQLTPRGIVYPIKAYSNEDMLGQPLSPETVKANENFWSQFDATLLPLLKRLQPSEKLKPMPGWQNKLYTKLHLNEERVYLAEDLAVRYSRASVYWGVEQQKLNQWEAAALSLKRALDLNPDNVAAKIDLAYNTAKREGKAQAEEALKQIEDYFAHVQEVLNLWGPLDEPTLVYEQSRVFLRGRLYRQGLQQLERVLQLEPRHLSAALSLADLYSAAGKPARSQEILQTVRQRAADFGLNPTNEFDVIRAEVNTLFATGKRDAATDALANALNRSSIPASFRAAAIDLYLRNGLAAPALPLIEQVLAENPEDLNALGQRGYACMQVNRFADARTSLDRALDLNPKSNIFRLNRAITLQHLKQFDDAQRDCEIILKEAPNTYQALFVLGEIAVEKKDTSAAARYFERCLNLVPVSSPDYKAIKARLDDLGSAKK